MVVEKADLTPVMTVPVFVKDRSEIPWWLVLAGVFLVAMIGVRREDEPTSKKKRRKRS